MRSAHLYLDLQNVSDHVFEQGQQAPLALLILLKIA